VSDEAYFEFSGVSCMSLIDQAPNLVVTRSFSKAFSLASLRIGYLVAQECIVERLRPVYNPKSVNMLAQIAAAAALDDLPYYWAYVAEVKRSSAMVERFCHQHGIRVRTSHANWVMMEFADAPAMAKKFADAGIHVRDRSSQLPGVLRMSLGTEAQTVDILSRMEGILDTEHKLLVLPHPHAPTAAAPRV
jgi:histidinol-phosphate aminotransferase